MATFTVDTHLFRELGELLVGRDSTALIELIKNAYDADATKVTVYGESITSTSKGFIRIQDNGLGMNHEEFQEGFLRIAARHKETQERRSKVFQRRYTGAKGIGRLAAHKLARTIEITSARWDDTFPKSPAQPLKSSGQVVEASIDWDTIESQKTLNDVDRTNAISVRTNPSAENTLAGTTITLRKLRRAWTSREHARFMEEIQAFQPPTALLKPIPSTIAKGLLFETPTIRDVSRPNGSHFEVDLEGELALPDDYWIALTEAASWIIEIDANRASGIVKFLIAPTNATREELQSAENRYFEMPHPAPKAGPFFQARILKRTGVLRGPEDLKNWAGRSSGIRVFMEGFRVLPYGDARDDWLQLDRDVAERGRWTTDRNADPTAGQLSKAESDPEAGLNHLPNKHYYGGVFLTERNAPSLKMLVNREGFIPDQAYLTLADLVRKGIDLSTRVQAAAAAGRRAMRASERRATRNVGENSPNSAGTISLANTLSQVVLEAKQHATRAKQYVATGRIEQANKEISSVLAQVEAITETSSDLAEEAAMMRVLASVGTQVASFIHEINGLRDMATAVDNSVSKLSSMTGLQAPHRRMLAQLQRDVGDLKRSIERHASYLVDVVSPDARRRRSRQQFSKRFDAGARLVSYAADSRGIKIINKISDELRSPPMFSAELTTIFSNLLTNAVKAAGKKGVIRSSSRKMAGKTVIRIENTGVRVRLSDSERWFRPFESTTTEVDTVLGQGMGLGLPITRSMLEEYGATIRFVEPSGGFSTAIQMDFVD